MLNWELLKHPLNWIIIVLMLVIAGAGGHLALAYFGAESSSPQPSGGGEYMPVEDRNDIAMGVLA
ncbi:MAG TPA: hypothetical protein VN785_12195 [Candidatus Angelobacter sp.]|nr:hypothetical protein [Candidatus Angelobacter sp.]